MHGWPELHSETSLRIYLARYYSCKSINLLARKLAIQVKMCLNFDLYKKQTEIVMLPFVTMFDGCVSKNFATCFCIS